MCIFVHVCMCMYCIIVHGNMWWHFKEGIGLHLHIRKNTWVCVCVCGHHTCMTTRDSIEHVLINAEPMAICDHAHGVDCLWVWLDGSLSILAQQDAFEKGEWGKMNARDRGALMYR